MTSLAPPRTGRKSPPSWWWFLGPAVLSIGAVLAGGVGFVATLSELDTRYGQVRADGEPHPVEVPAGQRVMVMAPTMISRFDWDCVVTDSRGADLGAERPGGDVSLGSEASSWESLVAVDAPSGAGEVTINVACSTAEEQGQTVLVTKAPTAGAMALRIGLMVLGPLLLGGIAFVWLIVLVVLHVVRRTERTARA